jgi:P-type Cu+ transporter
MRTAQTTLELPIHGMSCATCAGRIERVVAQLPAVQSVSVNLALERAHVEMRPGAGPAVVASIELAGFQVPPQTTRLTIGGMTCATCSQRLERVLRGVEGVVTAQVNLATEVATVAHVPGRSDAQALVEAAERAGFTAHPRRPAAEERAAQQARERAGDRRELAMLFGASLLTAPLLLPMLLAPLGVSWMPPGPVQLALALPVQLVVGARFYRGAIRALRGRTANMDVLVSLGTSAAFLLSVWHLATGGPLYFESAAVILTLVLFGKHLERRAKRSTTTAIQALLALQPDTATVVRDGEEVEVDAASVGLGDIVIVRPGGRIPVDGTVQEGTSVADESLLTGESLPVPKGPGDPVTGGSINGTGRLRLAVTAAGENSALARIIQLVEGAQAGKAPIQHAVDRVAAVFVPVVLLIAATTLAGWLAMGHPPEDALIAAVSVLVIACPCALGLATPTAMMVGTGAAARAGILIRDAAALVAAHAVDIVVFDKTGTLTEGRPVVRRVIPHAAPSEAVLARAAAVQAGSEHPLAHALLDAVPPERRPPAEDVRAHPGRGVQAIVQGQLVCVGSPAWAQERGLSMASLAASIEEEQTSGTVMVVDDGAEVLGLVAVSDPPRETAAAAIRALRDAGVGAVMLTGDNPRTAATVADALGITQVFAEVLPADKAAHIRRLQADGHRVAMVGDGVNDAPALAAADVGVAMATGTDVAMHAAGVTLMRPDPLLVADAIRVSRATHRKIRQNLFWAFAYNLVGLPLAALGLLSPMLAGAAMAASSVSVVSNALLLRRWRPDA